MDRVVADGAAGFHGGRRRVAYYMDSHAWPGGAEVWLARLMYGLVEADWEVSLFLSDRRATDPWASELASRGISVTRFRPTGEIDALGAREARHLLAGFPVVHFNKTHPRAMLPAIAGLGRAPSAAVVSTEHVVIGPASRYPFGRAVVAHLISQANRSIRVITTTSEYARRTYIENYGPPEAKVVNLGAAVPVGVVAEDGAREKIRREFGFGPEHFVAVIVGRLYEGKGLERAIEAVPALVSRVPGFRLLLVGSGPLEERLRRLAASAAPAEAVVFAGRRLDVPAVLAGADVAVLASDSETAGLAVLEAMSARLPVVATDVGGVGEAIEHGVSGILIPPRDARAIVDAIVSVAGLPDRGAAMGRAARETVRERYTAERLVGAAVALYDSLLTTGGGRET